MESGIALDLAEKRLSMYSYQHGQRTKREEKAREKKKKCATLEKVKTGD